jgi:hypothetical protein
MNTTLNPILTVPIRIRFAGTENADTFHMTPGECGRFHSDWKAFLGGNGAIGGDYASEEADHPLIISLNFNMIAYIEPGKIY